MLRSLPSLTPKRLPPLKDTLGLCVPRGQKNVSRHAWAQHSVFNIVQHQAVNLRFRNVWDSYVSVWGVGGEGGFRLAALRKTSDKDT